MIEHLKQLLEANPNRNLVREYLQARILGCLQSAGAMIPLAFHGGTALRFLYNLPRYSEDLDFALEGSPGTYNFRGYLHTIQTTLGAEGYPIEVKLNDQKTVHSAFVRFPGLLYRLGLPSQPGEVLAVKLEVDTHPPAGATLDTTLVRRYLTLQLHHHDIPSLFAGKLHALLQRPYTKGRDLYDLMWYLTHPEKSLPNLTMLNHALQQTGWDGEQMTVENWRPLLKTRLEMLDWKAAVTDVTPFLEIPGEIHLLNRENFVRLLG